MHDNRVIAHNCLVCIGQSFEYPYRIAGLKISLRDTEMTNQIWDAAAIHIRSKRVTKRIFEFFE